MNLLALVPRYKFERGPTLVLACDAYGLSWLRDQFAALSKHMNEASFVLGDGFPIASDGKCRLLVNLAHGGRVDRIERHDPSHFTWSISREKAVAATEMLSTLIASNVPGHQYVKDGMGAHQTVVVTKDEESVELIRSMRDGSR